MAQGRRHRVRGEDREVQRQRPVLQHVLQLGGLRLGEVAGDLGVAARDGAVGLRRGDHVPVQDDRDGVQPVVVLVGRGVGKVLCGLLGGQGGEGVGARALERQQDFPLVAGGGQLGGGVRDLGTRYSRHVQRVLVAAVVARDDLHARIVVVFGLGVPRLLLPLRGVTRGAVHLVEQVKCRLADQARVAEVAGGGRRRGGARTGRRGRRGRCGRLGRGGPGGLGAGAGARGRDDLGRGLRRAGGAGRRGRRRRRGGARAGRGARARRRARRGGGRRRAGGAVRLEEQRL